MTAVLEPREVRASTPQPPAPTAVTLPAGPALAVALVPFGPGPSAFGWVPALADRLQADLPLRVDLLHLDGELVPNLHSLLH